MLMSWRGASERCGERQPLGVLDMARPRTGNKRERMVSAAIDLFAQNGFHNTTTAQISECAGVAAGTL